MKFTVNLFSLRYFFGKSKKTKKLQVCLGMYELLVDTKHYRVKCVSFMVEQNYASCTVKPRSQWNISQILS